jgi:hypothetical protein
LNAQTKSSLADTNLGSPQIKRKVVNVDDDEILSSKLTKKANNKASSDIFKPINTNLEKHLHDELLAIFKTKKNREKMITIVEQTFKYRRSIIENSSFQFLDLLDQFKYLTDVQNVRELIFFIFILFTF